MFAPVKTWSYGSHEVSGTSDSLDEWHLCSGESSTSVASQKSHKDELIHVASLVLELTHPNTFVRCNFVNLHTLTIKNSVANAFVDCNFPKLKEVIMENSSDDVFSNCIFHTCSLRKIPEPKLPSHDDVEVIETPPKETESNLPKFAFALAAVATGLFIVMNKRD